MCFYIFYSGVASKFDATSEIYFEIIETSCLFDFDADMSTDYGYWKKSSDYLY